jgi:hypothetical protein
MSVKSKHMLFIIVAIAVMVFGAVGWSQVSPVMSTIALVWYLAMIFIPSSMWSVRATRVFLIFCVMGIIAWGISAVV